MIRNEMDRLRKNLANEALCIMLEFPVYVPTPLSRILYIEENRNGNSAMHQYEATITGWLINQLTSDKYFAYPALFGKHRDKSNGIHFKYKSDAMLFKLVCL